MKPKLSIAFFVMLIAVIVVACNNEPAKEQTTDTTKENTATPMFGGFESQVKWGEHIVLLSGCNDCHTPKKMGPNGPEPDMTLMLSGHPAQMPPPAFDAKEAAKKGLIVTQTFTAWTGPWGTTFAANLTPDSTGLGSWKEEQFIKALKEKKWMGLDNTRPLMPPMSMMPVTLSSDDELKAIFAYLKTVPPIHNIQPAAVLLPPPPSK
jgi:hypothetical protein